MGVSSLFELEFELEGSGTIDDPFIITNKKQDYDDDLEYDIADSNSYIKFEKILFKSINLFSLPKCNNYRF